MDRRPFDQSGIHKEPSLIMLFLYGPLGGLLLNVSAIPVP